MSCYNATILKLTMKKNFLGFFAGFASLTVFALVVWVFSLHGTLGLMQVEWIFRLVAVLLVSVGAAPAVLWLVARARSGRHVSRWLRALVVATGSLGLLISIFGFVYLNGFPSSPPGDCPPQLLVSGNTGARGIPDLAVVVYSRDAVRQTLAWGKEGTEIVIHGKAASRQHVFMLRDLEPETEYWYRVGDGPVHRFATPGTSGGIRFAAFGDAHFGAGDNRKDLTTRMLEDIASRPGSFHYLFSVGDLVESGFRDSEWREAFLGLSPAVSAIPTAMVAGNHDTMFTGLRRYLAYGYPRQIDPGTAARLWRRFDVGNVHFIVLNLEWSAEAFTTAQRSWLEKELKSIPREDWTIVLSHGFCYASGSVYRGWRWYDNPETIGRLTPLFEQYGVDLVISGHNHQMEILQKSGVTYVIAGAFGGVPDPERMYVSPASVWYVAGEYGYVDVTVGAEEAEITFRNADGTDLRTLVIPRTGARTR